MRLAERSGSLAHGGTGAGYRLSAIWRRASRALWISERTTPNWQQAGTSRGAPHPSDLRHHQAQWGAFYGTELELQLRRVRFADRRGRPSPTKRGRSSTCMRAAAEHGTSWWAPRIVCSGVRAPRCTRSASKHILKRLAASQALGDHAANGGRGGVFCPQLAPAGMAAPVKGVAASYVVCRSSHCFGGVDGLPRVGSWGRWNRSGIGVRKLSVNDLDERAAPARIWSARRSSGAVWYSASITLDYRHTFGHGACCYWRPTFAIFQCRAIGWRLLSRQAGQSLGPTAVYGISPGAASRPWCCSCGRGRRMRRLVAFMQ